MNKKCWSKEIKSGYWFLVLLFSLFDHVWTWSHVIQVKDSVLWRMTLNSWSWHLHVPCADITGVHPSIWFMRSWGLNPGLWAWQAGILPAVPQPQSLYPKLLKSVPGNPTLYQIHERHEWCHLHHEMVTKGLNSEQKLKHRIGERDKEISFLNKSSFLTKKRGGLGNLQ